MTTKTPATQFQQLQIARLAQLADLARIARPSDDDDVHEQLCQSDDDSDNAAPADSLSDDPLVARVTALLDAIDDVLIQRERRALADPNSTPTEDIPADVPTYETNRWAS